VATDAEEAVMRSIHERTVLVTGATSGLGRQLVQRLTGADAPSSHMAAMFSGSPDL
jgi:NADP-dependent 3-hydroxy acid dehydrogenase YdfG